MIHFVNSKKSIRQPLLAQKPVVLQPAKHLILIRTNRRCNKRIENMKVNRGKSRFICHLFFVNEDDRAKME
jgi:hypothetical protein